MKTSKLPTDLAKNASKLHKRVGELLVAENSPYRFYEIRQEYMVSKVNPEYPSNREKFDWAIIGLNVVIETMGEQHYKPIKFGGISIEEAYRNLKRRIILDNNKQLAAKMAGWAYVVVSYKEKNIDISVLSEKISKAIDIVVEDINKPEKSHKQKIPTRKNYTWPTRKIQNRKFETNQKRPLNWQKNNAKMKEDKE